MNIKAGTLVVLVFGFLVLVGMIVIITITGHDGFNFVSNLGVLLTAVAGFVGVFIQQTKQGKDIETVKTQTNGKLTTATKKIESLENTLRFAVAKMSPDDATEVIQHALSLQHEMEQNNDHA